jgi:CRISPR-associated protein Cmr2
MKHLIIFSIGPVQDFINTARRSRDLWYGSWMLSELARFVAKEIVKEKGKLIFPADTDIKSVPNKIVAVVETDNPKQFANKIKEATVTYLVNVLAKPTLDAIKSKTFNRTLADAQIEDLPELYWVSVPHDKEYKAVREQAEAMLIARKNTRDFNQMGGTNVPKSSLDGSRESVIDEDEYPDNKKDSDTEKANKVRKLYKNYHARQGERLSGVDLLKRLGARKDEPDFKSTSHMAAIPFMDKLDRKWGKAKRIAFIESIRTVFTDKDWDLGEKDEGALLYESRLTDWIPTGKDQNAIREELNKIWKASQLGESRPSPYYALLRADGDSMGEVINAQKEEGKHRELSEALSKFAGEVKKIVETEHNGLLIYAGGDDVLAYLPVNQALSCATTLEKKFKNAFREDPSDENSPMKFMADDKTTSPTLSVGIVIAHHLDPLADVLKLAKEAESTAKKDVAGKNGLAVTLSKRSGIDRTVVAKFKELYDRLIELKKLFDSKLISGGTAYELQELHRTLSGTSIPPEGIIKETLRILERKKESDGNKLSDDTKAKLTNWIKNISLHDLANEMIIAKSFTDGTESSANSEQEAKHES